jgi:lysophospholipase L1-like esterase
MGAGSVRADKENDVRHSRLLWSCLAGVWLLAGPAAAQFPDPERFENAITAFEAEDRAAPPPTGAIVLTGSSSIARWNDQAAEALAPLTVIPRGFGGSVMHDVLHYLERVALVYEPRAILIYEGDNDTGQRNPIPTELILADLEAIIAKVHEALPRTRIYVLSVKPSVLRRNVWPLAQEVSAGYRAMAAADPLVYYVDVANPFLDNDGNVMTDIFVGDNLHLNDLGNAIWGAAIKAALMPMEARFEPEFAD